MFFRNQKPKVESFEERVAGLKELRFTAGMESVGRCRVTRDGCGAVIEDLGESGVAGANAFVQQPEQFVRLRSSILISPQPRETGGGSQLPG